MIAHVYGAALMGDFTYRWIIDVDLGERGTLTQHVDGLDLLYELTPLQAPFLERLGISFVS